MAGQQAWLVLALCSIVVVVPCCAFAKAQLVYNSDGTPRLEIVNTGLPGHSRQGRWSWQTPEGTAVWIQYPVNHQGFIPWTPVEYTYSVASYPSKNAFPAQVPNNNYQSSTLVESFPKEDKNKIKIDEATSENPPNTESIYMDFSDTTERPRFTLPFTTTTARSLPFTPASFTSNSRQYRPSYSERYKPRTTSTTMKEETEYIESQTESPVEFHTVQSIEDALTTAIPVEESDIETVDIKGHILDISDKNVISATESVFENNVYNEETDKQIEDTTELGPMIRLTSRGRPQLFNNTPQKHKSEIRKQPITKKPNNRPLAQLIGDPSLRQINTRRPAFRENTEDRFRPRRPEIRNRPGLRFRPGVRRIPVADNDLATLNIQPDEDSNRGVARSPPLSSRLRSQGYASVRRT